MYTWKRPVFQTGRILSREILESMRDEAAVFADLYYAELTDGISIRTDGGWVWIAPSGEHAECTVVGEASDAEFARELCDFYASEIERLAKMEN